MTAESEMLAHIKICTAAGMEVLEEDKNLVYGHMVDLRRRLKRRWVRNHQMVHKLNKRAYGESKQAQADWQRAYIIARYYYFTGRKR